MAKTYGKHAATAPEGMFCPITFPVMLRLDEWTPDGRRIESAGFSSRELPLSVMCMFSTSMGGHDGAENCGSIDEVTVNDDNTVSGSGWLLNEDIGFAVARRIRAGALRGNSVDLVAEDYTMEMDESGDIRLSIVTSKLGGTTVCPVPAFEGAYCEIPADVVIPAASEAVEAELVAVGVGDFLNRHTFEFSTAASVRVTRELPPADAFANPMLRVPTPPMVTSDLRVYGHIAEWGAEHLSASGRLNPPRSNCDYAYFANGHVETNGGMIPTGRLVLGGQHAPDDAFWTAALDYYASTSRCWSDVAIGDDNIGIWFAGLVRPGTSDNDVYAARASMQSGDWRWIRGNLELVISICVNAGAFPNARPSAYAHEGIVMSATGLGMLAPRKLSAVTAALSTEAESNLAYVANRFAAEEAAEIAEQLRAEV